MSNIAMVAGPAAPFELNMDIVGQMYDQPHILGHWLGKTKLTPLHSDWTKYIWDADEERALQAHRGSYKTTAVLIIGAIRWMIAHPDDRIAIVRKTFTDAAEVVDAIGRLMETAEMKALFLFLHGRPLKATVRRHGQLTFNFKTSVTPEGNLTAHGLDGSLTGRHYDKIICDDFVTLKDRLSRAERIRTAEVLREIITNIIDPEKRVCFIGTPWHENDAWKIVPCRPLLFPVDACGLLNKKEIEHKKKVTTPFLYAANYDLKLITDEGSLFSDPVMGGPWNVLMDRPEMHLDAAYDGDHTTALTLLRRLSDGRLQGYGAVHAGNVKDWYGEIQRVARVYRVQMAHMETNADKGFVARDLRQLGIAVKTYAERQNKHIKISTYLYDEWKNIEWCEETDPEYLAQITDYREKQEPDDAPDSAASLIRESFSGAKSAHSALYQL